MNCPTCGKPIVNGVKPAEFPFVVDQECCSQRCADMEIHKLTTDTKKTFVFTVSKKRPRTPRGQIVSFQHNPTGLITIV